MKGKPRFELRGVKPHSYRDLIGHAIKNGWTARRLGSGHIRLDPPGGVGGPVVASFSTTSSGQAEDMLRGELRARGLRC